MAPERLSIAHPNDVPARRIAIDPGRSLTPCTPRQHGLQMVVRNLVGQGRYGGEVASPLIKLRARSSVNPRVTARCGGSATGLRDQDAGRLARTVPTLLHAW